MGKQKDSKIKLIKIAYFDEAAAKRFIRKAYSSYGKTEKAEVLENDNGRI